MSDHAALSAAVNRAAGRKLSAATGADHDAASLELESARRELEAYQARHTED